MWQLMMKKKMANEHVSLRDRHDKCVPLIYYMKKEKSAKLYEERRRWDGQDEYARERRRRGERRDHGLSLGHTGKDRRGNHIGA